MKKLQKIFLILAAFSLLFSCSKLEEFNPQETAFDVESSNWMSMIDNINIESDIILVQNGNSIQEAIDVAGPDASIYIEPGHYDEILTLGRSDIMLISAGLSSEEKVYIENPEQVAIMDLNSMPVKKAGYHFSAVRNDLGGGVAHYTFDVLMGSGPYDMVRIHRVIKERRPHRPFRTHGEIFMVHGAIQDFDDIFLTAGALVVDESTSAPYYMAAHGIDVWGIDLAWNRVPIAPPEGFEFMKDWGVEKDIDHVMKSLAIARLIRVFSCQGFSKLNLLGFSYGVDIAYGAAGRETQMHKVCRHIKGLIPVDSQMKSDDPDVMQGAYADAATQMELLNAGEYNNPWGVDFIGLGQVVLANPNGHDIHPVLTNIQILNAAVTDHSAGWHFLGGNPFALSYSDTMRMPRLSVNLAPHQPRLIFYELSGCGCPDLDVSYDDYLEQIELPILHISAEGSDNSDDYTSSLTKTSDYTRLHVKDPDPTVPPEYNFGHADLWLAEDAPEWVWLPLREWLVAH